MFDLINIFDVFLPQLLLYPNPADPLNAEAAALHMKNQDKFKEKVCRLWIGYLACVGIRPYKEVCISRVLPEASVEKRRGLRLSTL